MDLRYLSALALLAGAPANSAPLANLVLACPDENAIGQDFESCDGYVYELPANHRIVYSPATFWSRASDLTASDLVLVCTIPVEPGAYSSCRDAAGVRRTAFVPKYSVILTGSKTRSEAANVWVATNRKITLISPMGDTLLTVTPTDPPFFRLRVGQTMDADPSDGGLWVNGSAEDVMFKVGPSGALLGTITLRQPTAVEVDARDGSVWSTELTTLTTRDVVKFSASGQELVRITGFSHVIEALALDEVSGALWVAVAEPRIDTPSQIVRLAGSDEQLNGYDASADSGPRHVRTDVGFPRSLSADPRQGTVWVADDGARQFLKLGPTGAVLARGEPSFGFDAVLVRADPITGGAWGMVGNGDEGVLQFSSRGKEQSAILLFESVGDFTTVRTALHPRAFALDPYARLLWIGTHDIENFERAGGSVLLMNYKGEQLLRLRDSEPPNDIAIQTLRAPIVIGPLRFNSKEEKLARVAVLTEGEFDALQLDPLSGRVGPAGAVVRQYEVGDIDRDGDPDLLLYFKTSQTGIRCEDQGAELTARTHQGVAILSWAAVRLEGCPGRARSPSPP